MTRSIFALPEFRKLWTVGLLTFVVRWLEMLAVGLYAYQVTNSAFVVAMMTMLRMLPMGLFGAVMGAAAERFDRRQALLLTIVVSIVTSAALALLAWLGALSVWHVALASFINGTCWATDNPVRRMMIGDVVGAERMGHAMSLDVGTNNASRVLGPMISGVLLAWFGIAGVFWFSVVLYVFALAVCVRVAPHTRPQRKAGVSLMASMREGFAWVRRDHRLTGVLIITMIFNVFGWPVTSMIPVIGTDYLQLGPQGVGLLGSCDGFGGLIGAIALASLARAQWYGRIYVSAVAIYFVLMIVFAAAPLAAVAAVALVLLGIGGVGFSAMQATLVYRDSPAELRARLLGVLSVAIGVGPIGFAYLGVLADLTTPRIAIIALALQGMLAMILTRRYWMLTFKG